MDFYRVDAVAPDEKSGETVNVRAASEDAAIAAYRRAVGGADKVEGWSITATKLEEAPTPKPPLPDAGD